MAKNGSRTHTHTPHTRSNTQKLITEIFYRKPFAPRVQCELVIFIIIFILIVSRTFRLQQKFSVLLRLFFAFVYFLHAIITNRGTADVVCNPYVCVLCVDSVFLLGQVFFSVGVLFDVVVVIVFVWIRCVCVLFNILWCFVYDGECVIGEIVRVFS